MVVPMGRGTIKAKEPSLTMRGLFLLAIGLAGAPAALAADDSSKAKAMDLMHSAAQLAGALSACPFDAGENIAARSTAVMNNAVQAVVAAGAPSGKDALTSDYTREFETSKAGQTKRPANCDALLGKFGSLEMRAGTR